MTADAAALRALHVPGSPLLLANVWDAASAASAAAAGLPAVATSSVAVAESLGFPDGEGAPAQEMFAAAARVARSVSVPVTVDAESGYGLDAGEFVRRLLQTGAVGCNIEDTNHAGHAIVGPDEQAARIAALREAAGDRLVINARIDSFVRGEDDPLTAAIGRAEQYLAAGADCVYPIFIRTAATVGEFVRAVAPANVNITYIPGDVGLEAAADLGVARISMGGGLWRHAGTWLGEVFTGIAAGRMPY